MPTNSNYTPFHSDMPRHPDTMRLVGRLTELGMPARWSHLAWAFVLPLDTWCLRESERGEVGHLTCRAIAEICGWPILSRCQEFVEALIEAGFLERHARPGPASLVVHNFCYYNRRLLGDRERKRALVAAVGTAARGQSTERSVEQGAEVSVEAPPPLSVELPRPTVDVNRDGEKEKIKKTGNGRQPAGPSAPVAERANETATATRDTKCAQRAIASDPGGSGSVIGAAENVPAPPASAHLVNNAGSENATAKVFTPAVDRCFFDERAWDRLSIFAELLRRYGWGEQNVRRVVKWAAERWPRGDEERLWTVLAVALGVNRTAEKEEVRDRVALLIYRVMDCKTTTINETDWRTAKAGWAQVEGEEDLAARAWLAEVLKGLGHKLPYDKAQRI